MREDLDPAPELNEVPIERSRVCRCVFCARTTCGATNDFLVQECQRSGFTPNVTCHCYDTPMAMQMVLSGFGISFLPKSILSTHPGAPLKAKPVRGLPIARMPFGMEQRGAQRPCVQRLSRRRIDLKKIKARR